jgi:hypothetical protein
MELVQLGRHLLSMLENRPTERQLGFFLSGSLPILSHRRRRFPLAGRGTAPLQRTWKQSGSSTTISRDPPGYGIGIPAFLAGIETVICKGLIDGATELAGATAPRAAHIVALKLLRLTARVESLGTELSRRGLHPA